MQHMLWAIVLFYFPSVLDVYSHYCGGGSGCACPHLWGYLLARVHTCRLEVSLPFCLSQGPSGFIITHYTRSTGAWASKRVSSFTSSLTLWVLRLQHVLPCQGFVNVFQGSGLRLSALHCKRVYPQSRLLHRGLSTFQWRHLRSTRGDSACLEPFIS